MKKSIMILLWLSISVLAQDTYYYKNHKKETLVPIETLKRSISPIKYYKNTKGIILGVNKNLIIKMDNSVSLQNYVDKYQLEVIRELSTGLYLLKNTSTSATLDVANQLTLEEGVSYAHPDFIKKMYKR